MRDLPGVLAMATLVACAPAAQPPVHQPPGQPESEPVSGDSIRSLPPTGYGSLRQDEFSVELVDAAVHVKVTPLAEEVIRLAAPDTYDRLHALATSRAPAAQRGSENDSVVLFLVSFFSREPNVEYHPDDLRVSHRGRLQRPAVILPLTSGWGRQLLQPQETQSAIYAFDPPFDYALPLTIRYGMLQSDEWNEAIVPRLEEERSRVLSRAGGWTVRQR